MRWFVYMRIWVVCIVVTDGVLGVEPLRDVVPVTIAPTNITDVLSTVDRLWKDNRREWHRYVDTIDSTMNALSSARPLPDGAIIISEADLHDLLAHIGRLPIQPNLEDSSFRLQQKWMMIEQLSRCTPAMKTSGRTWLDLAEVMGNIRDQILPGYEFQNTLFNVIDTTKTKTQIQAMQDANRRKNFESHYQGMLHQISSNFKWGINETRKFAQSLPPDERKPFLNKIKELARSGTEEEKLLDTPIVSEKVLYPPVERTRLFIFRMSPEQREQYLEKVKRESNYTEEELKALEAPYEEEN